MFIITLIYIFYADFIYDTSISLHHVLGVSVRNALYLTYMLVGTCFYNYYKQNWKFSTTIGTIGFLLFITIVETSIHYPAKLEIYLVSYGFAFIIFSVLYIFKDKLAYNPILDFFANISFSLYLIHGVIGYNLITLFYEVIPNPYLVIVIVFGIVVLSSYLLYKFIELPSNKLGKLLVTSKVKTIPSVHNKSEENSRDWDKTLL